MSQERLGAALVEYIRRLAGDAKFLVMEAVPPELADALCAYWNAEDARLPRLAVAASDTDRFGRYALANTSAAGLRNSNPGGICVVVCEGFDLAERQSINSFVAVSPGALLGSKNDLMLLANAVVEVRRDGPMAAVREALVSLPNGERPSAREVSRYFDAIAGGRDPMEALPLLGAFRDPGITVADIRSERIRENLLLAASRRSDAVIKPGDYADIRTRAIRVLGRTGDGTVRAEQFMSALQSGDDSLLTDVAFDEAREILTVGQRGLVPRVLRELTDYKALLRRERPDDADALPWHVYDQSARELERTADRKRAAEDLLAFDAAEDERVFTAGTRHQLLLLIRDRRITATPGSAPEIGLARAIHNLGQLPEELVLVDPHPAVPPASQAAARAALCLAAARLRLAQELRQLEELGCRVDGDLLVSAFDGLDYDQARDAFTDAGLEAGGAGSLNLRLRGAGGSIDFSWAPDQDDLALLRSVLEFAQQPALSMALAADPTPMNVATARFLATVDVPTALAGLGRRLCDLAGDLARDGLSGGRLRVWVAEWVAAVEREQGYAGGALGEAATLAGCIEGSGEGRNRRIGMTPLAPMKAEWLADYVEAAQEQLAATVLSVGSADDAAIDEVDFDTVVAAISTATASHYPATLRLAAIDDPLLPAREGRVWTVFGGRAGVLDFAPHGFDSVGKVLLRLLRLQPEAAGHLKCLALGPGAATLLIREALSLAGRTVEGVQVSEVEIFAIGPDEPTGGVLAEADDYLASRDAAGSIRLRYFETLAAAVAFFGRERPSAHFALMTGLSSDGGHPTVNAVEVAAPEPDTEVLFAPRLWQRPDSDQRVLLSPPGLTDAGRTWARLAQALDDRWPGEAGARLTVPEMRSSVAGVAEQLAALHDLAMWVATLDRYATRDSLERALGDDVAILHQEQRLVAASPMGLVVSQKAGGPVDRAVARSLRKARIVADNARATEIGTALRRVAAQGYGILALEAATSGTGINELVGHVVGFSMLGKASTPWPLPPACRVLLVSLDEHADWFLGSKRADLLALAIDTRERGLHGAVIEVKARRGDETRAGSEALDQLKKSLVATSPVTYVDNRLARRIWLNRIAEAAYAVARESRIRLTTEELDAIEQFRRGRGTLEWAGLGLVFGPALTDSRMVHRQTVGTDSVPIAMHHVQLTEQRLTDAMTTSLRDLRTVEAQAQPMGGGRLRRRPETGVPRSPRVDVPEGRAGVEPTEEPEPEPTVAGGEEATAGQLETPNVPAGGATRVAREFSPPVLGVDVYANEPVLWRFTGPGALTNGHMQIWGSSGTGKTQFLKTLLWQLATTNNVNFGIVDFKNDYGPQPPNEDFPRTVGAEFIDMWGRPGAPYNPLALGSWDDEDTRVIEFRDVVEQAMAVYQRIGARQRQAIEQALRAAYAGAREENRWPTMLDLSRHIGADLQHILGDLTRYQIFSDGPALGTVVDRRVVTAMNRIPGNGQTTLLAAAFLLAVLSLEMQARPTVANTINYAIVVDEAHRVAQFKALDLMIREGRSRGLAVILATQAPADLPPVVDTNAQTRICFRLSDAAVASQAARKLDPNDDTLPDRIRMLGTGEALVSLEGSQPRLLQMRQFWRDGPGVPVAGG